MHIAVAPPSSGFAYDRQYVMGVLATAGNAEFAITASFANSFKTLIAGVPQTDEVCVRCVVGFMRVGGSVGGWVGGWVGG